MPACRTGVSHRGGGKMLDLGRGLGSVSGDSHRPPRGGGFATGMLMTGLSPCGVSLTHRIEEIVPLFMLNEFGEFDIAVPAGAGLGAEPMEVTVGEELSYSRRDDDRRDAVIPLVAHIAEAVGLRS